MKLLVITLLLSSCSVYMSEVNIQEAYKICEKNQGIKRINMLQSDIALIECNNLAMFKIGSHDKEQIDPETALTHEKLTICTELCSYNEGVDVISYDNSCNKWDGEGKSRTCISNNNQFKCICKNQIFKII